LTPAGEPEQPSGRSSTYAAQVELRLLRYYVTLAEELNYRRAAERLFIAQPSLSVQIRVLEKELGVRLFERSRRGVALSPAGAALLEGARDLLARSEELSAAARRLAADDTGRLSLGYVDYARMRILPTLLEEVNRRWPGAEVTVRAAGDSMEALGDLREGRVDAAVMRGPVEVPWAQWATLTREEFRVALPRGHALADDDGPLPLGALADETLALFARAANPVAHDDLMRSFAVAGATPQIGQESRRMDDSLMFVAAGRGVAIFPESVAEGLDEPRIVWRSLVDPTPTVDVLLVWDRHSTNPLVDALGDVAVLTSPKLRRPD
jgi:DNA-binding transcriptional LysR family regulator